MTARAPDSMFYPLTLCALQIVFYDYDYEIAKFSLPRIIFAMPLPRFPLELDIGARSYKTRLIGLPDGQKVTRYV